MFFIFPLPRETPEKGYVKREFNKDFDDKKKTAKHRKTCRVQNIIQFPQQFHFSKTSFITYFFLFKAR